jgi:hypothetical protein
MNSLLIRVARVRGNTTGTCFIQKIYALPLPYFKVNICPFSPSPLRLNIFRLFVILSLTQLYRYTPELFLFSTWNNYLYFKGLLYIWEEMIMMALLHIAGLENSECIWKIQRKPEVTPPFVKLKVMIMMM